MPAANINLGRMIAKCAACDRVFEFELPKPAPVADALELHIPRPERLQVTRQDGELHMRLRWFQASKYGFVMLFATAWMAFLINWYAMADSWIMFIFPIVHLAVGLGMIWFSLRGVFNASEVRLLADQLTSTVGPVPPRRATTFARDAVRGVFVRAMKTRPKASFDAKDAAGGFAVWITQAGQREACLLKGVPKDVALFIAQELRDALRLDAQPMPGSVEAPPSLLRPVATPIDQGALAIADDTDARGGLSEG